MTLPAAGAAGVYKPLGSDTKSRPASATPDTGLPDRASLADGEAPAQQALAKRQAAMPSSIQEHRATPETLALIKARFNGDTSTFKPGAWDQLQIPRAPARQAEMGTIVVQEHLKENISRAQPWKYALEALMRGATTDQQVEMAHWALDHGATLQDLPGSIRTLEVCQHAAEAPSLTRFCILDTPVELLKADSALLDAMAQKAFVHPQQQTQANVSTFKRLDDSLKTPELCARIVGWDPNMLDELPEALRAQTVELMQARK